MVIDTDIFIVFVITIMLINSLIIELNIYANFEKDYKLNKIINDDKPLTSLVVNDVTWRRVYISSVILCVTILFFIDAGWTIHKFATLLFITFTILYIANSFFIYHYFLLIYEEIENKICRK